MKDRLFRSLPVRAIGRFLNAQGPNWGTIIAWNLFFAFFPMVFLVISAVGLALHDPSTRATIQQQVLAAFPSCQAKQSSGGSCELITALNDFRRSSGLFAIVGVLGLLWSGASLFSAIENGLNSLYPCKSRDFLQQKLMAIGMVVVFIVMALPLLLSGSLLSLLQSIPGLPGFLHGGVAGILLQVSAGIVDASLLFGIIYYVVPHRKQHVRDIVAGAIAAGVLFETLTLVFPLYFKLVTNAPQWGQTFGLVFVLLFYFFLLSQIIVLGGALNAEIGRDAESCDAPGLPAGGLDGEALLKERAVGSATR
ncbi:MAG: YihY/virulence factor BrkB family protein [Candidatus Dormibacteraeota bacterium]|uniref:YihY/virulence factor BrkB family protein n=1 Tax=Candidatus Aeolococcus gillhamiae TaxID=3127015 RepID=A0A934JYZ2_9BACT|nr:YihY/virulence factor BrkB family protein [Candidatus Dormibacteraeota bacterium]